MKLSKRMIKIMMIGVSLMFCIAGTNMITSCYAQEKGSATTIVSYTNSKKDRFLLSVQVIGDGSVYDGDEVIRKQISKYELAEGEPKTFKATPDTGSLLKKVTLNGVDITSDIRDNKLTVYGQDHIQDLKFYFEKASEAKKPIKTGDSTRKGLYALGLIASIGVLLILVKRRDNEEQ